MKKLGKETTMTSIELVEVINNYRLEDGKQNPLRHDNFMTSIEKEFSLLNIKESDYINSRGKTCPMHELNKRQCMIMAMKESAFARNATMDYIEALEERQVAKPRTRIEMLQDEIKLIEANAKLEEEAVQLNANLDESNQDRRELLELAVANAPKVSIGDSFYGSGLKTMQDIAISMKSEAKDDSFSANKLNKILHYFGIVKLYKDKYVPTTRAIQFGEYTREVPADQCRKLGLEVGTMSLRSFKWKPEFLPLAIKAVRKYNATYQLDFDKL